MFRLSTVAVSTLVPALNVRSTTLPDSTFFSVVRTNAPPLPGFTCWNSTTVHKSPSRLSTRPFLRSFVVAISLRVSFESRGKRGPEQSTRAPTVPAGLPTAGDVLQREPVAVHAEPADHPGRHGRHYRTVPELLARVDVGDVHLDQRGVEQRAGVADRVAVVRPGPRVEHHGGPLVGRRVQPLQHLVFGVGLADLDVEPELLAGRDAVLGQLRVGGPPVDAGLAGAEPADVRPVEHVHLHGTTSSYAARSSASSGPSRVDGLASPSRTTKRSFAPRAFLSTRIAECSSSHTPGLYAVGSPTRVRTVRCRSAVAGSSRPARRPSAAAYTRPTDTACPCFHA